MHFTEFQRTDLIDRIRRLSHPLDPHPTDTAASGNWPDGIRAVLFDLYGTLFISGAGDIGVEEEATSSLYAEAAAASGFALAPDTAAQLGIAFRNEIARHHTARRASGIACPEVDVRHIWKSVLAQTPGAHLTDDAILRFAVEVECRVNPVWPMPGALAALQRLHQRGIHLGIVSNAQCFTPLLFDALLGVSVEQAGFTSRYCVWSWQEGEAKPSPVLIQKALTALHKDRGIEPDEVAFLGNDMLKDIHPASRAGCIATLFAGDARSLRLRADDPRCANLHPSRTVAHLDQL